MSPHIVSAFDAELQALTSRISEMGGMAEELLTQALDAVQRRDPTLGAQAVAADKKIDAMEMEIEQLAVNMIALRQPMAKDLRETVAALKITSTLERIGDLSKSIARRADMLSREQPLRISGPVVRMGRQALGQLSDVLDAYASRDTALAVAVWKRDVEIDESYNSLFRELITYMIEDPRTISLCAQMMFVAKNIERIGDHTTFLAEMVYYIVEGEPLGDDRPKGEPMGGAPSGESDGRDSTANVQTD